MIPDNEDREIKTMSVPYAGRLYYGLGRNGSYEAAKRGEIPVIKVGARLRVPVIAMERKLADAGATARSAAMATLAPCAKEPIFPLSVGPFK